jgi:hypothetical protein
MGAGIASAAETRSFSALPTQLLMAADGSDTGGECRVDVVRKGTPGSADITRQVMNNGSCVCTITTGPSGSSNGSAEAVVAALLRDRSCDGAPAPGNLGGEAAGGGSSGTVLTVLIGVGGAAGLAVALGNSSKG